MTEDGYAGQPRDCWQVAKWFLRRARAKTLRGHGQTNNPRAITVFQTYQVGIPLLFRRANVQ